MIAQNKKRLGYTIVVQFLEKVQVLTVFLTCRFIFQELDTPRAVDLETSAKVKVPDKIAQPDEDNDETTVGR